MHLVTGPEEYLFGEEKALLEVIEGTEPLPRWLPPYLHGLFATAPQLGWEAAEPRRTGAGGRSEPHPGQQRRNPRPGAWILANGPMRSAPPGPTASPGTVLVTIVGDVSTPGVVEVPMGPRSRAGHRHRGGPPPGPSVQGGVPRGGGCGPRRGDLDIPLSYEDIEAIGSGLGAGGLVVYDDSACMVEVSALISRFLYVGVVRPVPPVQARHR